MKKIAGPQFFCRKKWRQKTNTPETWLIKPNSLKQGWSQAGHETLFSEGGTLAPNRWSRKFLIIFSTCSRSDFESVSFFGKWGRSIFYKTPIGWLSHRFFYIKKGKPSKIIKHHRWYSLYTSKHTHQVWLGGFWMSRILWKKNGWTLSLSGIFWDHRTFSNCTQPCLGIMQKPNPSTSNILRTKSLNKLQGGPPTRYKWSYNPCKWPIKR